MLAGTYDIPSGSYGGFSNNLADSQDWSSFRGVRFWWYASQASNPASPTAGADIAVEVKDGGPDGEHSELWRASFKDNWGSSTSRWKLVELPFSAFTPSGYQPGSEATKNGTLDLTSSWGVALTFAAGTPTPVSWAIDDLELYGTPVTAGTVAVAPAQDVTLVDAGQSATLGVTLTTTTGEPTTAPVDVAWATGAGTAVGRHRLHRRLRHPDLPPPAPSPAPPRPSRSPPWPATAPATRSASRSSWTSTAPPRRSPVRAWCSTPTACPTSTPHCPPRRAWPTCWAG